MNTKITTQLILSGLFATLIVSCTPNDKSYGKKKSIVHNDHFVQDIDGNSYEIVVIGGTSWFANDLRVTRFRDGSPIDILDTADQATWGQGGSIFVHRVNDTNHYYYDFYSILNEKGICPSGYRVPTVQDWSDLDQFLTSNSRVNEIGEYGSLVKAKSFNGNNSSGLSLTANGIFDEFGLTYYPGEYCYFWSSSTKPMTLKNWGMIFYANKNQVKSSLFAKRRAMSIRCVGE